MRRAKSWTLPLKKEEGKEHRGIKIRQQRRTGMMIGGSGRIIIHRGSSDRRPLYSKTRAPLLLLPPLDRKQIKGADKTQIWQTFDLSSSEFDAINEYIAEQILDRNEASRRAGDSS